MMTAEDLNVSRETFAELQVYAALLKKWSPKINLVSHASLKDLWTRHIADSVQLMQLAPHPVDHWVDIGSGGGFPGLVIAIMAKASGSPARVTLVESDARKAAFLNTIIRETGAPANVVNKRIEELDPLGANVLSARALARLGDLLGFASKHLAEHGVALFPKGEQWEKELAAAQCLWKFDYTIAKSQTATGPVILSVSGINRV